MIFKHTHQLPQQKSQSRWIVDNPWNTLSVNHCVVPSWNGWLCFIPGRRNISMWAMKNDEDLASIDQPPPLLIRSRHVTYEHSMRTWLGMVKHRQMSCNWSVVTMGDEGGKAVPFHQRRQSNWIVFIKVRRAIH